MHRSVYISCAQDCMLCAWAMSASLERGPLNLQQCTAELSAGQCEQVHSGPGLARLLSSDSTLKAPDAPEMLARNALIQKPLGVLGASEIIGLNNHDHLALAQPAFVWVQDGLDALSQTRVIHSANQTSFCSDPARGSQHTQRHKLGKGKGRLPFWRPCPASQPRPAGSPGC